MPSLRSRILFGPKLKRILDLDEVFNIRGSGNPDRAIAPKTHLGDLKLKKYPELVEIFQNRICDRYINAAEYIDKNGDYNFVVTILCCVILDLWSQYVFGTPSSSRDTFKEFFRSYFKEYNHTITPYIVSCYYSKEQGKWFKERICDVADGLYHCFRCGVVHSGMILEYGRINRRYPEELIKIIEWEKDRKEINVNPSAFLERIKEKFEEYIGKLKNEEPELKSNFIKKLKFDYGNFINV